MISEYNADKTLKFLNTMRRSGVVDCGRGGGGESYSNPGRVDTLTIKHKFDNLLSMISC